MFDFVSRENFITQALCKVLYKALDILIMPLAEERTSICLNYFPHGNVDKSKWNLEKCPPILMP